MKQERHLLVKRDNTGLIKTNPDSRDSCCFYCCCCCCRWVSARGRSAPTSSAQFAIRQPHTDAQGGGQEGGWHWQKWCSVWSRPETRRRSGKLTAASACLRAPCSADKTLCVRGLGSRGGHDPATLFLLLHKCCPHLMLCHKTICCTK